LLLGGDCGKALLTFYVLCGNICIIEIQQVKKMTAKESKKIVKEMKEFTKKVTSSKEKAREFLVSVGTHTPKGNLTKAYR
jgi:hypothetical protein